LEEMTKDFGREYERRIAEEDGEKLQPLSGAGVQKEDSIGKIWLTQCKKTRNSSYKLNLKDLINLELNALQLNKLPKFNICFEQSNKEYEYVIITRKLWKKLNP